MELVLICVDMFARFLFNNFGVYELLSFHLKKPGLIPECGIYQNIQNIFLNAPEPVVSEPAEVSDATPKLD